MEIIKKYFDNLSETQIQQFSALGDLYAFWNQQINVISRKDLEGLYEKHVLHSLSIAKVCAINSGVQVADIGTGGGFPGIPLAILYPDSQFLLIDSIGKKIRVVQEVAKALNLKNVRAIHARAEEVPQHDFDLCVSRAVAPLSKLGEWSKSLLNRKGNEGLICLKGGDLKEEIKESGLKTKVWKIQDYFSEPFFETKSVVWTEVK